VKDLGLFEVIVSCGRVSLLEKEKWQFLNESVAICSYDYFIFKQMKLSKIKFTQEKSR
jgi:hypothetical protein